MKKENLIIFRGLESEVKQTGLSLRDRENVDANEERN
jgi:hypothetical protein